MRHFARIKVTQLCSDDELDEDDLDESPVGIHDVTFDVQDGDDLNELALDEFHYMVPIACVDHFLVELLDAGPA